MFKFADLDKKICLTCHYYRINRKVEAIGGKLFIDHDGSTGCCGLLPTVKRNLNSPPIQGTFCKYKRWLELP